MKSRDRLVSVAAVVAMLIVVDRLVAWMTGTEGWLAGTAGGGALLAYGLGHCDGLDGPVVTLARRALDSGNVNLVLPWVREADEKEVRDAYAAALAVRKLGGPAKELADRHFFETLVRIHRAGEGAPYTGLKPAGRDLGPAIPAADRVLDDGSIEALANLLSEAIREGLHDHFRRAIERKGYDSNDVSAGRRYVEAYVAYAHYVERLWQSATHPSSGHHAEPMEHAHALEAH